MRRHLPYRTCLSLLLLMLLAPGLMAADEPAKSKEKQAEPTELKEANIQAVIRELARDAKQEINQLKQWPRNESDYATANNLKADSEDVIDALGRRLDRNPAIDGYIKWQLLSFSPNFAEAGSRDYESLVRGMPDLLSRPQPTSRQRRVFAAFAEKGNPRMIPRIREEVDAWKQSVAEVERLNEPTIAYRNAILREIPEDNGLRMLVRLQEIEHRYQAGHPSYASQVNALIREARMHKDDPAINRAIRGRIAAQAERLKGLKASFVEDVGLLASGQVNVVMMHGVYRHKQFDTLMAYIEGRDPE